jgi:hypothetical protein
MPAGNGECASSDKTTVAIGGAARRDEKARDAISRQVMQGNRSLPFGEIFGRAARDLLCRSKPANMSGNERDELREKTLLVSVNC